MKKIFIISAVIMFSASFAYAGCVDTFGIGAKATSLGGAYSAYANDPYAVYYNPAGIANIEKKTATLGTLMIDPTIEVSNYRVSNTTDPQIMGPKDFEDESPDLIVPHAGYAMPIFDKFSLGIAFYAPWGLVLDWDDNQAENPAAFNYCRSYYYREAVTPTLAWKINDKFSVGLGISLGKSVSGEERRLYVSPDVGRDPVLGPMLAKSATTTAASSIAAVQSANQAAGGLVPEIKTSSAAYSFLSTYAPDKTAEITAFKQYSDAGLDTPEQIGTATAAKFNGVPAIDHGSHLEAELEDESNFSFNVGVMYKPIDSITVGLTYRSKTDVDFEGELQKNGVVVSDLSLEYDHPDQIQFGVRYVPESYKNFSIEFDLVWTHWSINDIQDASISPGLPVQVVKLSETNIISSNKTASTYRRDWEDTKQIRFGVEWKATEMITIRGGYFYDPSPIPDDTLDLMWSDADKKAYSLGVGLNFGKFSIDTTFQYTDIEKARYLGGESDGLNHSYDGAAGTHKEVSMAADGNLWGMGITLNYTF